MSTLLVVDDDPLITDLITYKLSPLGHEIHVASDGEAGVAAAHEIHPDLVLVDWMMPAMTGVEFCRAIRASDLAETPIILLTARATSEGVAEGMEAGATAYISKPFNPRDLVQQVTQLLDQAAPRPDRATPDPADTAQRAEGGRHAEHQSNRPPTASRADPPRPARQGRADRR